MSVPLTIIIVPQSRSSYVRATGKHYCATVAQWLCPCHWQALLCHSHAVAMSVPLASSIVPHPRSLLLADIFYSNPQIPIYFQFFPLISQVLSWGTLDWYSISSLYGHVIYDVLNFGYGFH
jgi:hypothetical protein